MSDKEFSQKVHKGLEEAKQDLKVATSRIKNPKYHEQRVGKALKEAVTELKGLGEETNMIQELLSIIDQVPAFVGTAWPENEVLVHQIEGRISAWSAVDSQLSEHIEQVEEKKSKALERDKKLVADVESGEIVEPTKMGSIRRNPGTRPESLANIRKAKESLRQIGEQTPKDSEG